MGKLDDKVALYAKALAKTSKTAVNPIVLRNIAKACGPSIYKKDASSVACSDPKELERVKKNFVEKKLGVTGKKADEAIAAVCKEYNARNKHRAVFYFLLAKRLKKQSLFK